MTPLALDSIVTGDAFEVLPQLAESSFDLILTDPPYQSLNKWKGVGTTARMGLGREGTRSCDPEKFYGTIDNDCLGLLLSELHRVLRPNRHAYVMCDGETLPHLLWYAGRGPRWCEECGCAEGLPERFEAWSNVKILVWDKVNMGMGYHYRCQYEFVVMLDKGKNRRLADLGVSDVLRFPRVANGRVPTEKPLALFELLIRQSTEHGETVLDPFMGSGTTGEAAGNLGRHFLGIEKDPAHVAIAEARLQTRMDFEPREKPRQEALL